MVKTKALISCAVNAQLICIFVFTCFSHDVVHIIILIWKMNSIIVNGTNNINKETQLVGLVVNYNLLKAKLVCK